MGTCMPLTASVGVRGQLAGAGLSLHHVRPRNPTQLSRLGGRCLYSLSHLNSPRSSSWRPLRLYFKTSHSDFWSLLRCSKNISWSCYESRMSHDHFRTKSKPWLTPGPSIPGSCLPAILPTSHSHYLSPSHYCSALAPASAPLPLPAPTMQVEHRCAKNPPGHFP